MSMLAEPRRKQKWSLNPRGKHWSEDQNKFGQKMLEKMGWSSGKGLGANEQGMTEHVRVSVKNNTAGFGYSTDKQDQAWTEQQENFNDFLQQLQGNQNSNDIAIPDNPVETLSGKSLELKSKQSRARVHYRKFTRGKDVNKYSAKDLANIFGQKDLTEKVVKQEEEEVYVPETIGSVDKTGGICTVNSGSISDYFKKKDFNFVQTEKTRDCRNSNSESESEQHVGFGFTSFKQADSTNSKEANIYAFDNPCLNVNGTTDSSVPAPKTKSKKRNKEFAFENGGLDLDCTDELAERKVSKTNHAINENNGFVNDALNLEAQADESHNGKEFEVSRSQYGLSNNGLDLTDEDTEKKRVTFNDRVEFSTHSSAKKKKTTLDKFEVESSKRKKKRKREENDDNSASMGFVNTALDIDVISDEVNDNNENERKTKKAKRKKDRRAPNLETIQEVVEEDKETQDKASIETIKLEETIEEIPEVNIDLRNGDVSKKKKKKKKGEKRKLETITVIDDEHEAEVFEVDGTGSSIDAEKTQDDVEEIAVHKEKKRKKKDHNSKSFANTRCTDAIDGETIVNHSGSIEDNGTKENKKRKKSTGKPVETAEEIRPDVEVTNKEKTNQDLVEEDSEVKLPKKLKKSKKSKEKEDLSVDISVNDESQVKKEYNEVEVEVEQSSWREWSRGYRSRFHTNRSPWTEKAKMSKRTLMTFFHRNLIRDFPGANVHKIKGYAAEIDSNI